MTERPRTLVVLRHGRTAWNDSGRAQGHTDVPLDEVGWAQARAVAPVLARLRPARLWSSDLSRAAQTAAEVARETGLDIELNPALREYDVGQRAGLTLAEFEAQFPQEYAAWTSGDESVTVAGAESTAAVRGRMSPVLRHCLASLAPGETGIVVTHGAALRVAVTDLLGLPADSRDVLRGMDNCGWLRLVQRSSGSRVQLASYNETAVDQKPGVDFASDGASG